MTLDPDADASTRLSHEIGRVVDLARVKGLQADDILVGLMAIVAHEIRRQPETDHAQLVQFIVRGLPLSVFGTLPRGGVLPRGEQDVLGSALPVLQAMITSKDLDVPLDAVVLGAVAALVLFVVGTVPADDQEALFEHICRRLVELPTAASSALRQMQHAGLEHVLAAMRLKGPSTIQ